MKTRVLLWIVGATAFLLGAMLYRTCGSYAEIKYDPTFSLGHVIGAVTTLLVAGLLVTYLQKQSATDRREKDLLFRHLDLILEELTEFERFKDGGVLIEITACLKRLSMKRQSIHKLLVELQYPSSVIEAVGFNEAISEIRELATKTPIRQLEDHANSKKCNSVVRNGIIELAEEKRALLDNRIQELKTQVIRVQLMINRL